ncbi:MAG: sugar transferase [Chthoniobacterales bacterium]
MSSRKLEIQLQLFQLIDACLIGLTFVFCYFLRSKGLVELDFLGEVPSVPPLSKALWILVLAVPLGPVLLEFQGFYAFLLEKKIYRSFPQILIAMIWLGFILGVCVIFFKFEVPSRTALLLFFVSLPVVLLLRERVTVWCLLPFLKSARNRLPVILAGEPQQMDNLLAKLPESYKMEWNVVEKIDLSDGDIELLVEAMHRHGVPRVVLCFHKMEVNTLQLAIQACETEGVEAWLSAGFIRTSIARPTYEMLGSNPMLVFRATPDISWALVAKGIFDRMVAGFALLLLSPVLLLVALAIRLNSAGPVVFTQRRAGLHGKSFTMYKFRSMRVGAEQELAEIQAINEMKGPVFKAAEDPRITRVGHFIRRTSLDELPLLFNVFKGEMSLVGPRPLPVYEVNQFDKTSYRRRLSMKPGLTCIWQVRGRSRVTSFDDWVAMDLEYIDNWSLLLDLWILIRTVPVVLLTRGAK